MDFKLILDKNGEKQWEAIKGEYIYYICFNITSNEYIVDIFEGKEHLISEITDSYADAEELCNKEVL